MSDSPIDFNKAVFSLPGRPVASPTDIAGSLNGFQNSTSNAWTQETPEKLPPSIRKSKPLQQRFWENILGTEPRDKEMTRSYLKMAGKEPQIDVVP